MLQNAVTGRKSEDPLEVEPLSPRVASIGMDALFVRWQQGCDQRSREYTPCSKTRKEAADVRNPRSDQGLTVRSLDPHGDGRRRPGGADLQAEPDELDDLLQVASIGLLKAIDRFDPGRGAAFSSFAVPTILGELKRHFRDTGWFVHVPRRAQELALKVQEAQERLSASSERSPTVQELAHYMEISVEEVIDALEAGAAHHSTPLDAPVGRKDGERATLADTFGAEDDRFELIDARVTLGAVAGELSERERLVLTLYFLEERTQSQIAEELGVSQMQVSRILRRAVERLRELTEHDAAPSRAR